MNANEIYKNVCEMLNAYDNATGNSGSMNVIRNPHFWANDMNARNFQPFYSIAARMLIDCGYAMDAANSKSKSTLPAIKRIIKATLKTNNKALQGIFETEDESGNKRYAVCDGHRIIRLIDDIPSIQHIDLNEVKPLNINGIMKDCLEYKRLLPLPTAADIKKAIAEWKATGKKTRVPMMEIDGFIWVDANYLLDMVEALPNAKAYARASRAPIYFKADNGDGMLCPLNPPKSAKATA